MRLRPTALTFTAVLLAATTMAACGDKTRVADATPTGCLALTAPPAVTADAPAKPEVIIPAAQPTALVVTDLVDGTGPAAAAGDEVVVNYVGVRSADGTEFDNSYKRGAPYPVTLGAGEVIKGWDQGLVGVRQGGRRQLDIPADLAYGDRPSGNIIQPGDALSFVIDVVAVVPAVAPGAPPVASVEPAGNIDAVCATDLSAGTGAQAASGLTAVVQLIGFRADTGEKLLDSFTSGQVVDLSLGTGTVLPGVDTMTQGMKVGGVRRAQVPFAQAFGSAGNDAIGLPGSVDFIVVVKLVAVY